LRGNKAEMSKEKALPANEKPFYGRIDERTRAVSDHGNAIAYGILIYGLLLDVMVRSFVYGQQAWDLMGLVIAGGLVSWFYQQRARIFSSPKKWRQWGLLIAISATVACLLALAVNWLKR